MIKLKVAVFDKILQSVNLVLAHGGSPQVWMATTDVVGAPSVEGSRLVIGEDPLFYFL